METNTVHRFLADAQALADDLLARVAVADPAAAARLADEIEAGRAVLSLALSVGRDMQAIELLVRQIGTTTAIASIPLRAVHGPRRNLA